MSSLYWDNFEKRMKETVYCLKNNLAIPVRRVAVFITNKCNFRCDYCNFNQNSKELNKELFENVIKKYGDTSIIHITGGEPSTVSWLYPFIESHKNMQFHLNTNAYLRPPKNVKRLKISLDIHKENYFNSLVHVDNSFQKVVDNIKYACSYTVTSITCVLTKENYKDTPEFMKWCRREFPDLYAVFFSIYKGSDERFLLSDNDVNYFFDVIKPKLEKEMDRESLSLFQETIDEKFRLLKGIRFPENELTTPCYLSMSERVIDWDGNEYCCSHLFRDGVFYDNPIKHIKCRYGCNRRLVKFNQDVEERIKNERIFIYRKMY